MINVFYKSFEACSPSLKKLWRLFRFFVSPRRRWFFEGCPEVRGQLWYSERELLYHTIRQFKPQTMFEVGTWYGGGSTYFISHALYENGCGILHTIEADPQVHAVVVENYRRYLPHLLSHVRFHLGKATEEYPGLLRQSGKVDAVFLDGAPDPRETLAEFEMFAPHLASSSIVLMHDWDNEKMALLRPLMEGSRDWVLVRRITAPHSVGFAVWTRAEAGP